MIIGEQVEACIKNAPVVRLRQFVEQEIREDYHDEIMDNLDCEVISGDLDFTVSDVRDEYEYHMQEWIEEEREERLRFRIKLYIDDCFDKQCQLLNPSYMATIETQLLKRCMQY